jgi:hypothetical protein
VLKPIFQAKDLRVGLQQGFWRIEWTLQEALHYERLNTSRLELSWSFPQADFPVLIS